MVFPKSNAERQQQFCTDSSAYCKDKESARYQVRKDNAAYQTKRNLTQRKTYQTTQFPPDPPDQRLKSEVIEGWVRDVTFPCIEESGCSVCGVLYPVKDLKSLKSLNIDLNILTVTGVTMKERMSADEPLEDEEGPVLTGDKDSVCISCVRSLQKNQVPLLALANGLWIGEIPDQLKGLTWMEQRLIAKVIYNNCLAWVYTGAQKMRANAISHAIPISKVYDILPSKREECEELLAVVYISPFAPKEGEYKHTPFIVRHNKVCETLEWLRLNHVDYCNIEISKENLAVYDEDKIPVKVIYQKSDSDSNKQPEATAVNDNNKEDGTTEGECPFVINTLTVDQYNQLLDPTKT